MQYSEDFFGTVPRIDESRAYEKPVRNSPAHIAGVNYTDNNDYWGWFPMLICHKGKVLHASSGDYVMPEGLAQKIVDSFNRGDDTGTPLEPLGIDLEHAIYDPKADAKDKIYNGYIVAEKASNEQIITYTASGVRVSKDLPPDAQTVWGLIAWLPEGLELVKAGQVPYVSIVFGEQEDGTVLQGKPTITGNPADTQLPAMVVCNRNTLEANNMDTIIAGIVEKLKTITDENTLQALSTYIDQVISGQTSEPPAEAPPAAANKEFEALAKDIAEIKALLATKIELSKTVDNGVIAAKEELIKAGYLPNIASEHANQFSGIKPENAVICAKKWLETNKPPQLGSQISNAAPAYPEDFTAHVKHIMATKGVPNFEAVKIAHEERGDK